MSADTNLFAGMPRSFLLELDGHLQAALSTAVEDSTEAVGPQRVVDPYPDLEPFGRRWDDGAACPSADPPNSPAPQQKGDSGPEGSPVAGASAGSGSAWTAHSTTEPNDILSASQGSEAQGPGLAPHDIAPPRPPGGWTPAEDLVLLECFVEGTIRGEHVGRLLEPVMDRLGRGQTDCMDRFGELVPWPQTERSMREVLHRTRESVPCPTLPPLPMLASGQPPAGDLVRAGGPTALPDAVAAAGMAHAPAGAFGAGGGGDA